MIGACGPKIYTASNFQEAQSTHKTLAILPFDVSIDTKRLPKGVTMEMLEQEQNDTGYGLQGDIYTYFLREIGRDHYTVTFQDINKTNRLLADAGINYQNIHTTSMEQLASILGVDALVSGKATMAKPMSDGAAVAMGLLIGLWGPTNSVNTTITVHEGLRGDLVWKYDYEAAGNIARSRQSVSNALMKNASKKFPYKKS